jgi:CRP/FNR family transcriptional regulator
MNEHSDSPGRLAADPPRMPGETPPNRKHLAELFGLLGIDPIELPVHCLVPVSLHVLRKGTPLFRESDPVRRLDFVRAGSFKIYQTELEGYVQVLGFAGRAEVLGFDALNAGHHGTSAVALEDSSVLSLGVAEMRLLRMQSAVFDVAVQRALSTQLMEFAKLAQMIAAVGAEVRLARFLIQLSARMARQGESASWLRMRMCRRDIASLLGVAIETVSRCFALLAQQGLLEVDGREIHIIDWPGLMQCARSTRRPEKPAAGQPSAAARRGAARPAAQARPIAAAAARSEAPGRRLDGGLSAALPA